MLYLMVEKLALKNLRSRFIGILTLLLCFSLTTEAQELTPLKTFKIGFKPVAASMDRQGFLYFASQSGTINKVNKEGKLQYHFSPQKQGAPTILEAWQGLRTFVYYKNYQEYILMDRFLNASERFSIDFNQISNFSGLATLAGDNNIWLINDQNLMLSKIDINDREVLIENRLNLRLDFSNLDIRFIRAYQNQLFIADANQGILAFDNLGNFMSRITNKGVDFFSFSKDNILFIQQGVLTLLDLYTKEKREVSLPDLPYQFVLMENNQIFLVYNDTVNTFRLSLN